jgi:hypothetical protein
VSPQHYSNNCTKVFVSKQEKSLPAAHFFSILSTTKEQTMWKLLVTSMILIGCGNSSGKTPGIFTFEASIQPHVNAYLAYKYELLKVGAGRHITIELAPIDDMWAGLCYVNSGRIKINPGVWSRLTYTQREQLIMHELMHCDLGMEHYTIGYDIMNETLMPDFLYKLNRDGYIREVFYRFSIGLP